MYFLITGLLLNRTRSEKKGWGGRGGRRRSVVLSTLFRKYKGWKVRKKEEASPSANTSPSLFLKKKKEEK